jgi:hypothetical protein
MYFLNNRKIYSVFFLSKDKWSTTIVSSPVGAIMLNLGILVDCFISENSAL